MLCCLCLSGCGAKNPENKDSETTGSSPEPTQSPAPTHEDYYSAPMPEQTIPEGRETVTLGIFGKVNVWSPMYKAVNAFNQAQEKYFVKIEAYNNIDRFRMDLARKQGTDLYSVYMGVNPENLVTQGVFEDLTPYFEKSDAVGRDDIVDAVWRAGSVGDKLYFLIPCFICHGILVEKGHTKEGAWSGKDYIELGKRSPGSMLNQTIQTPTSQFLSELEEYMLAFVNWEDRTCSFDSDAFIALLEDLKALSSYKYEAVDGQATTAELIHGKTYLSTFVTIQMDSGLHSYREIKDAFGDGYEIAGLPTADGSLKYDLDCFEQIYGMNAASQNKEGAWAFLEYLLSEEYQQPEPPNYIQDYESPLGGYFPARKDSLEKGLQAYIDYVKDPNEKIFYVTNRYSKEKKEGFEGFTEEDRQAVLRIIDNSYRLFSARDSVLLTVLVEETEAFFQGQKSAKDVAKIIQSKITLYLTE